MNRLIKFSILSISLLTITSSAAVSPALAGINQAFPHASVYLIRIILTLPALIIVPFSLLSGILTNWMNKKLILLLGITLFIIGGIGPAFVNNVGHILVLRAVLGAGVGFIMPLSQSLIADFYEGTEKIKLTGYATAVSCLGGAIANIFSGILVSISWRWSFSVYLLGLISLFLVLIGLPTPKGTKIDKSIGTEINKKVYLLAICIFLSTIAFYAVPTNIAIFIKSEKLGGSSIAGLILGLFTCSGFVSGILLYRFSEILKKYISVFSILIMTSGYSILYYTHNIFFIALAVTFVGFGYGVISPVIFLKTSNISNKSSNAVALSIVSSSLFMGQFSSPIILQFIDKIFINDSIRFTFGFLALSLIAASLIILTVTIITKENKLFVNR